MPDIIKMKTGKRMSAISICNGIVYLAGQTADDKSSFSDQAEAMLSKVDALLFEAGSSRECILSATVYLKDMSYFSEFNEIWEEWMPEGKAPSRACVQAQMARESILCEISIIAAQK